MSDYVQDLFGLDGQVAVVTGATGVLCGQMAQGLAAAGAKVVVVGRDHDRGADRVAQIEAAGGTAMFCSASATSREDVEQVLATTLEAYGRVDILVNGAGMNRATPFLEITEEEWNQILDVNLRGAMLACQVFGQYFLDNNVQIGRAHV